MFHVSMIRTFCSTQPIAFSLSRNAFRACSTASSQNISLYQYATCPFCNRVKAVLDYKGLEYKTIEVNPLTKTEIKFSGSKSVPVVQIDGNVICDSGDILEYIRGTSPDDSLWTADSQDWMTWSEKKLAVLLYPNITRTFGESWKAFAYVDSVQSWTPMQRLSNRVLGPVAMFLVNSKIKKKYGIEDERAELLVLLREWTDAVGGKKFFHGDCVTIPDLMVFGVLRGIDSLPTFEYIVNENSDLKKWYNAMKNELATRVMI